MKSSNVGDVLAAFNDALIFESLEDILFGADGNGLFCTPNVCHGFLTFFNWRYTIGVVSCGAVVWSCRMVVVGKSTPASFSSNGKMVVVKMKEGGK